MVYFKLGHKLLKFCLLKFGLNKLFMMYKIVFSKKKKKCRFFGNFKKFPKKLIIKNSKIVFYTPV